MSNTVGGSLGSHASAESVSLGVVPMFHITGLLYGVLSPVYTGSTVAQDIIDWAREQMAVFKAPHVVQFVDALPRSGSGKVMWRQMQEQG